VDHELDLLEGEAVLLQPEVQISQPKHVVVVQDQLRLLKRDHLLKVNRRIRIWICIGFIFLKSLDPDPDPHFYPDPMCFLVVFFIQKTLNFELKFKP